MTRNDRSLDPHDHLFYSISYSSIILIILLTGVFGVYGIDVNPRHLSLIADFMTRTGSYLPMNRMGMNECSSPFLQMSFETTSTFLTKAASEGTTICFIFMIRCTFSAIIPFLFCLFNSFLLLWKLSFLTSEKKMFI